jgi:hypothetical protein
VVVSTCSLSRTAIRVLSLWCSGCCQTHIVYVSGPLSMFHLNNPYISSNVTVLPYFTYSWRVLVSELFGLKRAAGWPPVTEEIFPRVLTYLLHNIIIIVIIYYYFITNTAALQIFMCFKGQPVNFSSKYPSHFFITLADWDALSCETLWPLCPGIASITKAKLISGQSYGRRPGLGWDSCPWWPYKDTRYET